MFGLQLVGLLWEALETGLGGGGPLEEAIQDSCLSAFCSWVRWVSYCSCLPAAMLLAILVVGSLTQCKSPIKCFLS